MESLNFRRPGVVISGTFHRDHEGLEWLWRELETNGCRILAPSKINFIDTTLEIVRTPHEYEMKMSINEMERFYLRAIRDADMVWLHAPDGHVGVSMSFEIGYALACHKPVFSKVRPVDAMLAEQVIVVSSVFESFRFLAEQYSHQS